MSEQINWEQLGEEVMLSDGLCKECNHHMVYRECDCDEGYAYHDCGEDTCCCTNPEEFNIPCEICEGKGVIEWCEICRQRKERNER